MPSMPSLLSVADQNLISSKVQFKCPAFKKPFHKTLKLRSSLKMHTTSFILLGITSYARIGFSPSPLRTSSVSYFTRSKGSGSGLSALQAAVLVELQQNILYFFYSILVKASLRKLLISNISISESASSYSFPMNKLCTYCGWE